METASPLTFLVNALWQVPLVTVVAALAAWLLRHGPAGHRHAVWVAALAAATLAPLASVRTGAPPAARAAVAAGAPAPAMSAKAIAAEPILVPFAARTARVLVIAYGLFLLFRLALLMLAGMRTARIRRAARRCGVPRRVEDTWARCRRAFGLEQVELLASPTAPGPLMAGAWRRSVIVPDALLAETSQDVLTAAIGHELAHAKRHDFSVNLLCELLYIPIAFNPVAWILRRAVQRTREMACDEMVTAQLLDPGAYACSILSLAAAMARPEPPCGNPGCSLGVFDGGGLEARIRGLLGRRAASLPRARLLLAAGLAALAICAVAASGLALSARAQNAALPMLTDASAAQLRAQWLARTQPPIPPPPMPPPPPGYRGPAGARSPLAYQPSSFWEVMAVERSAPHAPARAVMARLKSQGFPTAILRRATDSLDHIVAGPYPDDSRLRDAKARLEALGYQPRRR